MAAFLRLAAAPQDISVQTDDIAEADSAAITPDSLFNRALETFKNVKFLKFEGEQLDVVSPEAYKAFQETAEVLPMLQRDTREWARAKEILRELDRDLLSAAYFYSSAGIRRS